MTGQKQKNAQAMFDLKGFRKDRKLSQKQISEILGIGTSFISQIETGKDPMPGYIPDKLADAFGKEEVEKYHRESSYAAIEAEKLLRKRYLFPASGFYSAKKYNTAAAITGEAAEVIDPEIAAAAEQADSEWIDRVLKALERRDELAMLQHKEYEKQGARIDELLAFLRGK
jgi:transcriptional regulator with XRE-family HTH domain